MYTYVKGKGWLPETPEFVEITVMDGLRYRVERRKPNPGELYSWFWPIEIRDGFANTIKRDYTPGYNFKYWEPCADDAEIEKVIANAYYPYGCAEKDRIWYVVVPV